MKIRTLFIGIILGFLSTISMAGSGHDHGHSHSNTPVSQEKSVQMQQRLLQRS